jgi:hypothetical protein
MRRRIFLIPALLSIAVLIATGLAQGEISQKGNLRITFSGTFSPRELPRDRLAPISVSIKGQIGTTDESQPPALNHMEFSINRNGKITTVGLPVCTGAELQSTTTQAALARCGSALVGRGHFGADVKFAGPAPFPARGAVLAFNSTLKGKPAILLHLFGTTPVQATFILPLTISHTPKGDFGTILSTRVPRLAGGFGSVTEIDLELGRNYSFRGKRLSYLSASCAAPGQFTGVLFSFARGRFEFADGRALNTTVTRDCRVR